MPSEESFVEKAESFKTSGNEAFAKEQWNDAIQAYSMGLAQIDRMVERSSAPAVTIKTSLLSNRAAAHLKLNQSKECQDDCTTALDLLTQSPSSAGANAASLHSKLLYRRAKAEFLLANSSHQTNAISNELLHQAAKDLLSLLSDDPKNTDASKLLQMVRNQHSLQSQATNTPIAKTLEKLMQLSKQEQEANHVVANDDDTALHQVKVLLGLITNDLVSGSMELGRRGGVKLLLDLAASSKPTSTTSKTRTSPYKLQSLALSCLASAGSHPPFCRAYCQDIQPTILSIVKEYCHKEDEVSDASDVIVSGLALYLRLLLHLDRDDPKSEEISADSKIDSHLMNQTCLATLAVPDIRVVRATLDLLSTWTAGTERDATIRASLAEHGADHDLPTPKTPAEVRSLAPRELSAYRKREYQIKQRDQDWAQQRAFVFCKAGGIKSLLKCAMQSCQEQNVSLRREVNVVLGRLLAAISDEKGIQSLIQPFLGAQKPEKETDEEGLTIEEVYDEDEETKKPAKGEDIEEDDVVPMSTLQERAELTSALLLAKGEVGAWALSHGWDTSRQDLRTMIASKDRCAMFLASEVISAAASVEKSRPMVAAMLQNGSLETLLGSEFREVRSGVASAIAKLDLSEKKTDEGEVMGLLQVAVDLLYETEASSDGTSGKATSTLTSRFSQSSGSTSSMDRGIEMLNYLVSQTRVKEELAHGFKCNREEATNTALERLVELASRSGSGESLSAYAMATVFMHMAVTAYTLRKEAFAGKDISMEEYDQLQQLGKTQEEKDADKEAEDTQDAVEERIRLMARANVPRALVQLMEGASDTTIEQVLTAMNRMAVETSVRGLMIQQGVLSACIKVERGENPSAIGKNILRLARHCIAKLLATSNPSLLTASQRMGSIKPLIQLVRDSEATDLQSFEALLAITNVAAAGDDTKERIIAERGIATLSFAMFSNHEMVRRAATEAMCNLVPHPAMMEHLADPEHAGLWLAFAADYENNYECARAAAGCLAMATQEQDIAKTIVHLKKFKENIECLLESGRLELMHRVLVMIYNLTQQDDEECRQAVISNGLAAFCRLYVESYYDGSKAAELDDISPAERNLIPVTIEIAEEIIKATD